MHWKEKFRKLVFCGALLAGVLGGAPLKPEEIEELMHQSHRQKQVEVAKKDDE